MREVHAAVLALIASASSCYHLPIWHGTLVVHPLARASIKQCGTGALTPEGRTRVTREPYLQSTTTHSTVIAWGSKLGHEQVVLTEPDGDIVRTIVGTTAGTIERGDVYKAPLLELDPGHLYCYQLLADNVAITEPAPLTTAAPAGLSDPFTFVALGDTGTGGEAEKAIAQRMTEYPFDMMLFLGDIAYESGSAKQLQDNFFAIYADLLRYVPAYPAMGNHERRTQKGKAFFESFVLPDPERYYSFDWGDVHFVAIDTTHRDSEQLAWLRQDLAQTKQRWKIVFGHHPLYTNSLRGPQSGIRRAYGKIFTDAKVDLVLTGHEHQYERFRVAGVNYVISGGGGGQLTRFFGSSKSLMRATTHHFLQFAVTANTLVMKAIDINGREIEQMKLDKERDDATPEVRVDDKPETKQTPIAPEKTTTPDEVLHDGPDEDKDEPHLPPQKVPGAPDKPTPPSVPEPLPSPTR